MSNIFFTSDTHAYHKNILKFCPTTRHGDNAEEMVELLVQAHNSTVGPDDEVWNLGDVSFGNDKQTLAFLRRLNGKHRLILGNHDQVIKKNAEIWLFFESVSTEAEFKIGKQGFYLHHFAHRVWNKAHHGVIHLYGHSHGGLEGTPWGKSMDVGIDARPLGDMKPWHLDEILEIMKDRPILGHHDG